MRRKMQVSRFWCFHVVNRISPMRSSNVCMRHMCRIVALVALLWCARSKAEDLIVHLHKPVSVSKRDVIYACDSKASKLGVSSGAFLVEYINGGGNSLAVVPILGNPIVFANVTSGSGARYVAQQYTWWEAKNESTLSVDSPSGSLKTSCHPVRAAKN
jgi:membrane-bound inhibitor of C-type lysozyme